MKTQHDNTILRRTHENGNPVHGRTIVGQSLRSHSRGRDNICVGTSWRIFVDSLMRIHARLTRNWTDENRVVRVTLISTMLVLVSWIASQSFTFAQVNNNQPEAANAQVAGRFEAVPVFIDAGDDALAAFQLELTAANGLIQVVGVEEGESKELSGERFYFDREVIAQARSDRVIVAAFSTAKKEVLPTGRVRVATIHVFITAAEPNYQATLVTAATIGGQPIDAHLSLFGDQP